MNGTQPFWLNPLQPLPVREPDGGKICELLNFSQKKIGFFDIFFAMPVWS